MTQKYQVKVSMKQAAIVETGIVLKQGDFGMQLEIEVLDFDATGTTPQIVFRKAMGAVESTTITVSGNKYTYTFKGTELDTPGKVFCDLKLKNSTTQRISTASFMFKVVADTLDGLAEESSSYSDTISQIINQIKEEIDLYDIDAGNVVGYGGQVLADADDAPLNKFFRLFTNEPANYPAHMPVTEPGFLLTIANKMKSNNIWFCVQFFFDNDYKLQYSRKKTLNNGSGTWGSWEKRISYEITNELGLGYAASVLSDANDAEPNSIYQILATNAYYPANMPVTQKGYLFTLSTKAKGYEQYFWRQYFLDENLILLYSRNKTVINGSGSWNAWTKMEHNEITNELGLGYAAIVLSDANEAKPNSLYKILGTSSSYYPANMPITQKGYLFTLTTKAKDYEQYFWTQYFFDESLRMLYSRKKTIVDGSGNWNAWEEDTPDTIASNPMLGYGGTVLTDADDAKVNSIYRIVLNNQALLPAHLPELINNSWLITLKSDIKNAAAAQVNQYLCDNTMNVYYRRVKTVNSGSGSYQAWVKVENTNTLKKALGSIVVYPGENLIDYNQITKGYYVDYASGNRGALATYDYAIIPVVAGQAYRITDIDAQNAHVAFFSEYYDQTNTNYISGIHGVSFTAPENATYATVSFPDTAIDKVWCNTTDKYIKPEIRGSVLNGNNIRVSKDGTGDFAKLTDALAYGMEHENTTIYLDAGEYDLIEELGSDYFANFEYVAYTNMGPMIGNGTQLICSPKAKVTCHYTGDNTEVAMGFSPLNPSAANNKRGIGDFTIDGLVLEASNVRYCVHDDIGIQTIPYTHIYKRCQMSLDNTHRLVTPHSHRCIGGGLGVQGTIIVEDCYFDGAGEADNVALAWHNDNYSGNPQSSIVFKNNYFAGVNTIELASIGSQTVKTKCLVTNNSLGSAMVYRRIGEVDNMEVIAWNNELRSNS